MTNTNAPRARVRRSAAELAHPNPVRRAGQVLLREVDEGFNLVAFCIMQAAASVLPKAWALGVADAIGLVTALSPVGLRTTRRMAFMFGRDGAFKLARKRLTLPFRDHVTMARLALRRERPAEWQIESRNAPALLSTPDASFIVAMGHFSRDATIATYFPSVIPHKMAVVLAPLRAVSRGLRAPRLAVQLGQMAGALRAVRDGDINILEVGQPRLVNQLIKHLKQAGRCVVIASDAPWPAAKGGLPRPFAGRKQQNYALGTARLARMAQCPIVSCVPVLEDGRLILKWGAQIPPPAPDDSDADARITDMLLDELEHAIGLHPDQYVLLLGGERSWDSVNERWVGIDTQIAANDSAAPAALATAAE